jgi:Ca2+/Na+ antiporter
VPLGLTYLLLAPFPWQLASLRQAITLPEMIVWWLSIPLLVLGAFFTIKHRLREIAPIIIFTSLLTLTYSIMQGNVGTAYRQRAQLLIFYFVFVAVGFVLVKERREARTKKQKEGPEAHQHRRPYSARP